MGAANALLADHLLLPYGGDRLGAGGRQLCGLPDPRRPRRRDQSARLDRGVHRPGVRPVRAVRGQPALQRLAARGSGLIGSGRHVHVGDGRSGLCDRVRAERAGPLQRLRRHAQGAAELGRPSIDVPAAHWLGGGADGRARALVRGQPAGDEHAAVVRDARRGLPDAADDLARTAPDAAPGRTPLSARTVRRLGPADGASSAYYQGAEL